MVEIGIVGAGVAAAGAAHVLARAENAEITVFEATEAVGGRAATRDRNGVTYDYGANYLTSDDRRVSDLLLDRLAEGLIDVTEPVYTFDREGRVTEGRDADEHKWSYESGLATLVQRLFEGTDVDVRTETRVAGIDREAGWRVVDATGRAYGPFDRLVLTPPAPETAGLLREATWGVDLRDDLVAEIDGIEYRTIWSAVLHYPFEVDRPYYALVNTDKAHEVGWIAREECKPGHVPPGESLLVVQATHEWSIERADTPPEENAAELAALTADVMDDSRLENPDWFDHRNWRHALPESGADERLLREAEDRGLYFVGDWVAGEGRLHAALRRGLETGDRIVESIEE